MDKEYISHSEAETEEIGASIASEITVPAFIALYGEMGSGKTAFMRGFVGRLVPAARVSSPTYAILNVYADENCTVNHFDLYRITSPEDLDSIGFEEICEEGISVCEWAENIPFALPEHYIRISFEKTGINDRKIRMERI